MIPLRFGTSDRPLTGIFDPPSGSNRRRGVVICAPLGDEYMRSHRACRVLSTRLSEQGKAVLRFDYFGTGSSGGNAGDFSFGGAVADARTAIQEVMDLGAVRRVTLVGLRLGALIAAHASQGMKGVDRLVLWDPILDGQEYAQDQLARDVSDRRGSGVLFTRALGQELAGLEATDALDLPRDVLLVTSAESPEIVDLRRLLEPRTSRLTYDCLPDLPSWVELGNRGAGAVPAGIISRIGAW